ncbi:MAG: hypothetical protein WBP26_02580 [Candidatus Saccharimonadales bacterium]
MSSALLEKDLSIGRPPEPALVIASEIDNTWLQAFVQVCNAVESVVKSQSPKKLAGQIAMHRTAVCAARSVVTELGLMQGSYQVHAALASNKVPAASKPIILPPDANSFRTHYNLFAAAEDLAIPAKRRLCEDDTSYIKYAVAAIGKIVDLNTPDATDAQRSRIAIELLNHNGVPTNPIGRLSGDGSPLVLASDIQLRIPLTPNAAHVEESALAFGTFYNALDERQLPE